MVRKDRRGWTVSRQISLPGWGIMAAEVVREEERKLGGAENRELRGRECPGYRRESVRG